MKKVLFCVAIIAVSFTANAQDSKNSAKPLKFRIGPFIGLPLGDIKDFASVAYGGDLQGEYAAAEQVGITLSAGYLRFSGKMAPNLVAV